MNNYMTYLFDSVVIFIGLLIWVGIYIQINKIADRLVKRLKDE